MSTYDPSFSTAGTHRDDQLIAGDHPIRTTGITVLAGQTFTRGSLLGRITASGKYVLSLSDAVDGSQAPAGIAVEDVTAAADTVSVMYIAGDFNVNQMTIGASHTTSSIRQGLADKSIYLHNPVPAYDPPASPGGGS